MPFQKPLLPRFSLVLGGAASGKSAYGEGLCEATGRPMTYFATAIAGDGEMAAKIERHRERRGTGWHNVEAPHDLAQALGALQQGHVALIDCATFWLFNQIEAGAEIPAETARLIAAIEDARTPVVVVSNETGMGLVPEHAASRAFRQAQGELNQRLAAHAGLVVFVAAGLPLALKGQLPARAP